MTKERKLIMESYNKINIYLRNGEHAVWEADKGEWDDYSFRDGVFIVMKNGAWVGLYSMDCINNVVVK